jgi:replicative DNA helicase
VVAISTRKRSGEALLISTMINTGLDPAAYGITEEMLTSHQTHFRWLRDYPTQYGHNPSLSAFLHAFPQFSVDESTQDIKFACEMVRREHRKRQAVKVLTQASEALRDGEVDEAIQTLQQADFVVGYNKPVNVLETDDFFDVYHEKPEAMELPWPTLQRVTGGLRKGDLMYIAARMGNGKSWLLADIAAKALMDGRKVKFYSLEMPTHQVTVRMHVKLGRMLGQDVNHIAMRDRVFDVAAYKRLVRLVRDNVPGELYIHDMAMGRVNPYTISQDEDMDLVCVDYAGLMDDFSGNRAITDWRAMAVVSNGLKEVAQSKSIRIAAAAQINRDGITNGLKCPRIDQLSQSDMLGMDGDVVVTHKQVGTVMGVSVEKNRHGDTGDKFFLRFQPNIGDFPEISKDDAEDIYDTEDMAR